MGIFAADKRLAAVFCEESFYRLNGRIHLALHVAGPVEAPIVEHTFIVYKAVRVLPAEIL